MFSTRGSRQHSAWVPATMSIGARRCAVTAFGSAAKTIRRSADWGRCRFGTLDQFWPSRWTDVGRPRHDDQRQEAVHQAKAHIRELVSPPVEGDRRSLDRIRKSTAGGKRVHRRQAARRTGVRRSTSTRTDWHSCISCARRTLSTLTWFSWGSPATSTCVVRLRRKLGTLPTRFWRRHLAFPRNIR